MHQANKYRLPPLVYALYHRIRVKPRKGYGGLTPKPRQGSWGYTRGSLINSFSNLGRFWGSVARTAHGLSAILLIPVALPFAAASAFQIYAPNHISTYSIVRSNGS